MSQQSKKPGYGNCRAMETRENKLRFPPFPQRWENPTKNVGVFHSYHSPYDWIHIKQNNEHPKQKRAYLRAVSTGPGLRADLRATLRPGPVRK